MSHQETPRILETPRISIPSPEDLPDPGIEPGSPTLQADSLPAELPGEPVPETVSDVKHINVVSELLELSD